MNLLLSFITVAAACFGAYMGYKSWGYEVTIVILLGAVVGHLSILSSKVKL